VQLRLSQATTISARIYAADAFLGLTESPQVVGILLGSGIVDAEPLAQDQLDRYEAGVPVPELDLGAANFIPSANDPDNTRETDFVSLAVSFEQRPSETFAYSLAYHGLVSDRTFEDGPQGVSFEPMRGSQSEFDARLHTVYARADFRVGAHNFVTAGYELEKETFLNRSLPDDPAGNSAVDVSQYSNTFFVQDQLGFLDGALQVSGAFRVQLFSLDAPIFAPAAAAPYQGIDFESPPNAYTGDGSVAYFFRDSGTKLRAHVGNGYRAPSLFERFGTFFSAFGYSVFGDPRLGPERSIGFDTGVDQDFAGGRVRTSATFFFTRLQEVILFDFSGAIDPTNDPFGRFGGYRRVDGGEALGFELSGAASPTRSLHLTAAYTYTDAEPPTGPTGDLVQAFVIPDHELSIVATQSIGRDFYINFDLTASSDYLAPIFDPGTFTSRAFRFGGIVKADLGASYTFALSPSGGLRFFGKVDNLFDQRYFENGFRTAGRMGVGGVAFEF
jgi:iron complex outermembrane receptor protein